MIVNRDFTKPVEFEAALASHITAVEAISPMDGSLQPLGIQGGKIPLSLEPGDGTLLRLTTAFRYPEPPPVLEAIDFQFNTDGDDEGFGGTNSLSAPVVKDGLCTMDFTGNDPFVVRGNLRIAADQYSTIRVRMKLPACNAEGQLFWTTGEEPGFADDKYLNFPVIGDGQWHEYEIPVGTHEKWAGKQIRAIRLDPTTGGAEPGTQVQIDWIVGA